MPKYLTISDDLQLIPGEGCRFLSKSGKTLDEVLYVLLGWLDDNPTHPFEPLVNAWLECVDQSRDEQKRTIAAEFALRELEASVRKCLTIKYRRKGLSVSRARQEAARDAVAATVKLMED
jgi:hypothetical protein